MFPHSTLVTHQTGPEGKKVNILLIEEGYGVVSSEVLANVLESIEDKYIETHRLYSKFESLGVNKVQIRTYREAPMAPLCMY